MSMASFSDFFSAILACLRQLLWPQIQDPGFLNRRPAISLQDDSADALGTSLDRHAFDRDTGK